MSTDITPETPTRYTGFVTFDSGKGWYFAENEATQCAVFIHAREVENQRRLRVDDRVEFDLGENPKQPGKICALNVKYLGHVIARQVGEKAARS
jgi:cold shock CspA family protein